MIMLIGWSSLPEHLTQVAQLQAFSWEARREKMQRGLVCRSKHHVSAAGAMHGVFYDYD
jgi:hypothetical protein